MTKGLKSAESATPACKDLENCTNSPAYLESQSRAQDSPFSDSLQPCQTLHRFFILMPVSSDHMPNTLTIQILRMMVTLTRLVGIHPVLNTAALPGHEPPPRRPTCTIS